MTAPSAPPATPRLWLAANNGDIGGGEVMLLRCAEAARSLGVAVGVVAPRQPSGVVDAARKAGLAVAVLDADSRRSWMAALRRWDRRRVGVLWCHGLVPATATAGHRRRIVELHQQPRTRAQRLLATAARPGSMTVLVPSHWMASRLRRTRVLENWTGRIGPRPTNDTPATFRVGYLGRMSTAKGIDTLATAMARLEHQSPGRFRLVVAGEARFVDESERRTVDAALRPIEAITDRLGWVEPTTLLHRVDALVVASREPESFGLTVAEAMAARCPVVVTAVGALPEVVGGPAELVVPPGDPESLAKVLEALADGSVPDGIDERYERWSARYSPTAGTERVKSLLGQLAPDLFEDSPAQP